MNEGRTNVLHERDVNHSFLSIFQFEKRTIVFVHVRAQFLCEMRVNCTAGWKRTDQTGSHDLGEMITFTDDISGRGRCLVFSDPRIPIPRMKVVPSWQTFAPIFAAIISRPFIIIIIISTRSSIESLVTIFSSSENTQDCVLTKTIREHHWMINIGAPRATHLRN